jgi:Mrp family chromosome partitioning ATPase
MSALDKAFIKAHTKDPVSRAAVPEGQPAEMTSGEEMVRYDNRSPAPAGAPNGSQPGYRVDDAHWTRQGPHLASCVTLPPSADDVHPPSVHASHPPHPAAPGSAGPWNANGIGSHADPLPSAGPHATVPAASVSVSAPPDPRLVAARLELPQAGLATNAGPPIRLEPQAVPLAPPPASASSQRAPHSPSIFVVPEPEEVDAGPPFAPDWEVDRLVWPVICERLLETEERYFRSVGQRLKDATQDSHHVVMITGARRGEGRTTLALCLARCAAQAGVATALVDADLENPQLGNQLGMETPCSWLAFVAGASPLSEAGVSSLEDGLTLFPLTNSEDLETPAGDEPLTTVLRAIGAHFPLVIVDTGPMVSEDRHAFAAGDDCPIDTAIVVRDLRNTTEKKALATARLLQRRGVPAVGIAENFRDPD